MEGFVHVVNSDECLLLAPYGVSALFAHSITFLSEFYWTSNTILFEFY